MNPFKTAVVKNATDLARQQDHEKEGLDIRAKRNWKNHRQQAQVSWKLEAQSEREANDGNLHF